MAALKKRLSPWARLRLSLAWKLLPDADFKLILPSGIQLPITRRGDLVIFNEIFMGRLYDSFFSLVPQVGSFVDLGCNCGFFTAALMAEAHARGWNIISGLLVDAEPQSVALSRALLQRHHWENFQVTRALVGQSGQEKVFTISKKSQCSGAKNVLEPKGREVMRAASLATLLQGRTADLLKIDIEGSEIDLLESEAELIASFRYVILEWHVPHCPGTWVRDWIQAHNLKVLKVDSDLGRSNPSEVWNAEAGLVLWTNE
jgi:FkbM family methyltransferase